MLKAPTLELTVLPPKGWVAEPAKGWTVEGAEATITLAMDQLLVLKVQVTLR